MITVNELFSGIGAFRKALENLKIEHKIIGISEIDKYAIKSYEALYGKTKNYGDISKILKLDYADLWTYGFPCQDISIAGQQKGIKEGETRSGLLYAVKNLLIKASLDNKLPKFLIMENVKNLVGKRFISDFEKWLEFLKSIGYENHWQVLNSKDYGVPQSRSRVFCVSIRNDIKTNFNFPKPQKLELRLLDILEKEVEEKYYINNDRVDKLIFEIISNNQISGKTCVDGSINNPKLKQISNCITARYDCGISKRKGIGLVVIEPRRIGGLYGNCQAGAIWDKEAISPTLNTCQGGYRQPIICVKSNTKKGFEEINVGDSVNIDFPNSLTRRGRVGRQIANTILASNQLTVLAENYKLRKLTPCECWRLMGFDDESFQKAKIVNSDSQLYKQAGNSIVVPILEKILGELLK